MLPVVAALFINEERRERRDILRNFRIQRMQMRNTTDIFNLDEKDFRRTFRLSRQLATDLMHALVPLMNTNTHPNSLSAELKVFIALSFYATGSYQKLIGQSYNISASQQSISTYIKYITNLIVANLANEWIKFPITQEQKNAIKEEFWQHVRFPGIIGAIDCTHVRIMAPTAEERNYVNRKGFHSKNIQIVSKY